MDQKIATSQTSVRNRLYIPFVNDNYIPQGTATRFEVVDGDSTALFYVSLYHMTRGGVAESKRVSSPKST